MMELLASEDMSIMSAMLRNVWFVISVSGPDMDRVCKLHQSCRDFAVMQVRMGSVNILMGLGKAARMEEIKQVERKKELSNCLFTTD